VRDVPKSNDVDLIAIADENPVRTQEFPPLEIDFRFYSSEGLEDKITNGNDYLGWAIHFGKALHEKEEYWGKLVGRLKGKVPMPSPQTARERAAIAAKNVKTLLRIGDSDAALEQIVTLLTHVGRAILIEAGVYPASRPELPSQLSAIGCPVLAKLLTNGIEGSSTPERLLSELESDPAYKSQQRISP
jgi:hypothetical protein